MLTAPLRQRLTAAAITLAVFIAGSAGAAETLPVMRGVGGDFQADSSLGRRVALSDYRGRVVLLTFGYTNCPDVCPITLGHLDYVVGQLPPAEQQQTQVMFVTVDPEYDTAEHLQKYLKFFNDDFIGITGNEAEVKHIADSFGIAYHKTEGVPIPTDDNRNLVKKEDGPTASAFNHPVTIFLIDKKSRVRAVHYSGSPSKQMAADISRLLAEADDGGAPVGEDFWIRRSPPGARTTAIYGRIVNNGAAEARLLSAKCPGFADAIHAHQTVITNGQAEMRAQEIIVAPDDTFIMAPMSSHLMAMGLRQTPDADSSVTCDLHFTTGTISITATVRRH